MSEDKQILAPMYICPYMYIQKRRERERARERERDNVDFTLMIPATIIKSSCRNTIM